MKSLIIVIIIFSAAWVNAKPQAKPTDMLQKFWDKTFVTAIEKHQADKIVSMAVFPFYIYEGEEKKHIIDEQFFRSIIKVLFNKQYIQKLKAIKIKDIPFDGTYYKIKFNPAEATQNFNEIFNITGCYNYLFKPSQDGSSLLFSGMEINLPCGN